MNWVVLGESVAGTSHRARNTPCQDAFRFRVFGPSGHWFVIAAADGAGSASHSEAGARLTCDEFVQRVEGRRTDELFTPGGMAALFAEVRDVLIAEAERLGVAPRQVACTAMLAVLGEASATFAQVGDGAIVYDDGAGYQTAFWPEPTEYANATDFLTDDRFGTALRFAAIPRPIRELAVLTDGLQRLALDFAARRPHPAFFQPLFRQLHAATDPESLAEPFRAFLDSPRVNERTDDDKTLVLAVRRP
jgi:hypothetical protein